MSIGEFFNKKSRRVIASIALIFGAAGGYVGGNAIDRQTQPQQSNYTIAQVMSIDDAITEEQSGRMLQTGRLPAGAAPSAESMQAQADAVAQFTARIDHMQSFRAAGGDILITAVDFVNALRVSENLSEQDYANIVKDYNARIGLDVTAYTGNWQDGIRWQQEANLGAHFAAVFDWSGDEDPTPQQISADVGSMMKEGSQMSGLAMAGGAAGGAALGGLLLLPLWMRERKRFPKVNSPKGAK